jgi:hypothetical protein
MMGNHLYNNQAHAFDFDQQWPIVMSPFFRPYLKGVLAMLFGLGSVILHKSGNTLIRILIWTSWAVIVAGLILCTPGSMISVLVSGNMV